LDIFCAVAYVLKSGCLPMAEEAFSLLEQALKKWGWHGPYQPWSEREDQLRDR